MVQGRGCEEDQPIASPETKDTCGFIAQIVDYCVFGPCLNKYPKQHLAALALYAPSGFVGDTEANAGVNKWVYWGLAGNSIDPLNANVIVQRSPHRIEAGFNRRYGDSLFHFDYSNLSMVITGFWIFVPLTRRLLRDFRTAQLLRRLYAFGILIKE